MGVPDKCWAPRKLVSASALALSTSATALSCGAGGVAVQPPTARLLPSASVALTTPPEKMPAARVPALPHVDLAEPCQVAAASTEAAIARARAFAEGVMAHRLAAGTYPGPKPTLPIDSFEMPSWLSCVKTPGGAWAIVLAKALLTPRHEDDWTSAWVLDGDVMLAHVDTLGVLTLAPIDTQSGGQSAAGAFLNKALFPGAPNCCDWVFGGLEPLELFDFDRDGEPEVHVGASYSHEGEYDRSDALFTFKNGKLEPYAPAAAYPFEAMKDRTGDGIPDLLMSQSLSGGEACGSGFPADGSAMEFIAHALPGGTFSADDAAARAFAKKSCPKNPSAIKDLSDVLCARLWGGDTTKLELQVRGRFVPWDCEAEMASRPQKPNARGDFELMLSATKTRVPFTLP